MEGALSGLGKAKEERRLLPGPRPQARPGTGAETAGRCGLTAGQMTGQWVASLLGPLTLRRPGHQLSRQEWLLWKGLAAGEEAQSVPASPRSRSGAKASSQATAAPLARPPGTVKCTAIPARGQVLTLESHSTSSHFLLLVSATFLSSAGSQTQDRPGVLTS